MRLISYIKPIGQILVSFNKTITELIRTSAAMKGVIHNSSEVRLGVLGSRGHNTTRQRSPGMRFQQAGLARGIFNRLVRTVDAYPVVIASVLMMIRRIQLSQ